MQEDLSSELVNNKGAGLPAHQCRLLNTFVIRLLESVMCKLATQAKFQFSS